MLVARVPVAQGSKLAERLGDWKYALRQSARLANGLRVGLSESSGDGHASWNRQFRIVLMHNGVVVQDRTFALSSAGAPGK